MFVVALRRESSGRAGRAASGRSGRKQRQRASPTRLKLGSTLARPVRARRPSAPARSSPRDPISPRPAASRISIARKACLHLPYIYHWKPFDFSLRRGCLTISVLTLCCELVTTSRNPGLIRAGDPRLGQHVAPGSIVDTILFIVFYTSRSPRQVNSSISFIVNISSGRNEWKPLFRNGYVMLQNYLNDGQCLLLNNFKDKNVIPDYGWY